MIETLLAWDREAFHWINAGWSHGVVDLVLPAMRNKYFWFPLYVFCLAWIFYNFPRRHILIVLGSMFLGLLGSDSISSRIIKNEVKRPRPCQEAVMTPPVVLRVPCGAGYSFTSSHAANHFFFAAFLVMVFGHVMGPWRHLWWGWASLVGLAQVYVGVHYPSDILGGAFLGLAIGIPVGILCRRQLGQLPRPVATSG